MGTDRRIAARPTARLAARSTDRRLVARSIVLGIGFAAALSTLATPAQAVRFFIPRDHKTIQAGVDAASPGDTIWVAAGTYKGTITLKKSLVLFGDAGAENTILDGGDSVRVLHIEGVKNAAVIGFTIRRGKANAGGGIHCLRDTSVLFAGCLFQKNWESAISAWESRDLNLRELRFEENSGSAFALQNSSALINGCEFVKNHAYSGGAISFNHSGTTLPLRNCVFEDNRADDATGGAINADSSDILIADSGFKGNSAKIAGGAVASVDGAKVAITRCRFTQNHSAASGAVHADKSGCNIAMSVFEKNHATALGSAIGLLDRGIAGINPIIQNNTFYKNESQSEGTAIWNERVSPEIRKNIFFVEGGQRAVAGLNTSPLYECNLIYDPSGAAVGTLPSSDTLVGDPLFCDAENGNFFLRDLSPAVLATCAPIGAFPKKCSSFKLAPGK